jgi:hypothetical protein
MGTVTIDLDEFLIDEDVGIYVYGEADLTYEKSGEGYHFSVETISISPHRVGGNMLVISKSILKENPNSRDAMLFQLIADAIEEDRDESIEDKIHEQEANELDAWLSDAYDRDRDDRMTGDL